VAKLSQICLGFHRIRTYGYFRGVGGLVGGKKIDQYTCTDNPAMLSPTYSSVNVTGVTNVASTTSTTPTANVLQQQQQKQQTVTIRNNATITYNALASFLLIRQQLIVLEL
jgi:hypothetical protein